MESSADQLGAGLIAALRKREKDIKLSAVGGSAIEASGVTSKIDISGLSILGFSEALRAYPLVVRRVKDTVNAVLKSAPDVVVLIDSWGFMIRVSQRLKRAGFKGKIIKYVAPQVWAMRAGRGKTLAKFVDHLLSIHSFDAPYFEKYGLAVTHVGNPMFDTDFGKGDASAIMAKLKISSGRPVCAVLFGSRVSEYLQLRDILVAAVVNLKQRYPDMVFISPISETLQRYIREDAIKISGMENISLFEEAQKFDVFAASDVAIACSGTVTTQLASVGIPTVVTYLVNPLTWWAGKRLYKPDYVSLINISAGKELMPEFLQTDATPQNLSAAVSGFLDGHELRATRSAELKAQANVMRGNGGSASDNAAEKILSLIAD